MFISILHQIAIEQYRNGLAESIAALCKRKYFRLTNC